MTAAVAVAPAADAPAAPAAEVVDQTSLALAQRLAPLAIEPREQSLAQAALRYADHVTDLAFATALQRLEAHPPTLSPEANQIAARLAKSQELLAADQSKLNELTADLAKTPERLKDAVQDEIDLVRSQLELDQDEVAEANQDLEDAGGNLHRRIERLVADHDAAAHARTAAAPKPAPPATSLHGLVAEFQTWRALRDKGALLEAARADSASRILTLGRERQELSAALDQSKSGIAALAHHSKQARASGQTATAATAPSHLDAAALLAATRQIVADQKVVSLLDQRINDQRGLVRTYDEWSTIAATETRASGRSLVIGLALVLGIIAILMLLDRWLLRLFAKASTDRRQIETLRSVTRVGLQVLGVLIIVLVTIGLPEQFGTVLGLVGAGLTVALKDFIVAFIGWFVLMGRNGIRLGDWVEINGVSGEVIQLGMFHTVLLETGNWSDAGQPTGRRVTFTNSFAIEGHYFNFSTSGQWLWDELQLVVPAGRDPYPLVETLQNKVSEATAQNARDAEQEWTRAVPAGRGRGHFSGVPGVALKPVVGGVEIAIRYLTRANERHQLRARLYQAAVDLLGAAPPA